MTLSESQELIDMHFKADRILKLIRANALRLEYSRSKGVVNEGTAIRIRQNERLEFLYDDLICKIANVTITSRKVNV